MITPMYMDATDEILCDVLCMYEPRLWWVLQGGSKRNPGIPKGRLFSENAPQTIFLKSLFDLLRSNLESKLFIRGFWLNPYKTKNSNPRIKVTTQNSKGQTDIFNTLPDSLRRSTEIWKPNYAVSLRFNWDLQNVELSGPMLGRKMKEKKSRVLSMSS